MFHFNKLDYYHRRCIRVMINKRFRAWKRQHTNTQRQLVPIDTVKQFTANGAKTIERFAWKYCKEIKRGSDGIRLHIKKMHEYETIDPFFIWNIDQAIFNTLLKLNTHFIKTHLISDTIKTYKKAYPKIRAKRAFKKSDPVYCDQCRVEFKNPKVFRIHIKEVHVVEHHECIVWGEVFLNKYIG